MEVLRSGGVGFQHVVAVMSQCTCTTDKEATCIVHPTTRSLKEYIEASQNLLRALNQRIDQLENEKSLMAKHMGKLASENIALREAAQYAVDVVSLDPPGRMYHSPQDWEAMKALEAALEQEKGDE